MQDILEQVFLTQWVMVFLLIILKLPLLDESI